MVRSFGFPFPYLCVSKLYCTGFICCAVDLHKRSSLKLHAFVTLQFCAQKAGEAWLILCFGFHNVETHMWTGQGLSWRLRGRIQVL